MNLESREGLSFDESCFVPTDSCYHEHVDSVIMSMPFYYNDTLYCDSLIVKFSYDIYICDDSVIIFDNFSVIAFWGCDNLDYLLAYLQNIGDYDEIARIIDMIEFQASLIFEQEYIKGKLQALVTSK